MILRTLKLENIRSYIDQTVSFPMGTTLFEGGIGSGKSTILMAIEFALFGLGSERGGALLKAGAKKGQVELCFEVEGKEYELCRSLERKAKSVQQSDCTLRTEGTILQLSASEMKERVLEILSFNEPADPKARSVIYRYAIFTPQEEMKAILSMTSNARLQTLRRAFRIEDYRIAVDNSSVLAKALKEKSIALNSHAADLEANMEKCKAKTSRIKESETELVDLEKSKIKAEATVARLQDQVNALQESKSTLGKAVGEVPLLGKQIKEKGDEITGLLDEVEKLSAETKEKLQTEVEKLSRIEQPTSKTEAELKEELDGLRRKERELRRKETAIDTKIADYESVEKEKVCPTCDRPADPKEFEGKIRQKREEKGQTSKEVADCESRIREVENLQDSLRQYKNAQDKLQNLNERMGRNSERIEKAQEKIGILKQQIEEANANLEKAKQETAEYDKISKEIRALTKELDDARSQLEDVKGKASRIETTRDMLRKEVDELEKEIQKMGKERSLAEKLEEYRIWLEEFLMPTLETIEKHVMLSINQEFNQHFQKWWSMLVEDPTKESRIDEDFTPLIEQDGYEQDYDYMSGGERTSLALAYRLSLNTIVQKVSAGIKSNLLILDEPTDGFSKEQLFKIREILDELKCPQVIMVSHEKELESFADHVLRIEKIDGVSQVKPI